MLLDIHNWLTDLLEGIGISGQGIPYLNAAIILFFLTLLAYLSLVISKQVIIRLLHSFFLRTKTKWDDLLIEYKIFNGLAHIVPALIIKAGAPIAFADFVNLLPFVLKITDIYILIALAMLILSFLKAMEHHLSALTIFKDKPISSYFQLARIIFYIGTGILVLSILMGKSPLVFLSAFGAMTAILLLVFKDTILGLVASVQISSNDMFRVGDWVEMPKFNADGDVLAINLNTVKIRNWDKTITTVPTYYFITDSFKNWRGMQESGGRRIMRSIYINMRSIKFVDKALRERIERFHLIKDFVDERQKEIEEYNATHNVDTETLINGRRMTNVGVFRQYITAFLKNKKGINQNMYMLVRQLQPDSNGLPIQLYCFTESVAWIDYESVQADVFDHLLAAAKYFDLEVFQNPSGNDITLLGEQLSPQTPKTNGSQLKVNGA